MTIGLVSQLLEDFINYADLVILDSTTPEVLKDARLTQIEAGYGHDTMKQEIVDKGNLSGRTVASMFLAQEHFDKKIQVKGELTEKETEVAVFDAAPAFKKELLVLKNWEKELSQLNTSVAKVEVVQIEKEIVGR